MHQELPPGDSLQRITHASGVLKNRSFLYLWIAQALSQTALHATVYMLLVRVEERTASSAAIGLLILSFILPSVVMGAAAGVFVDRWQKQRVLLVTNILRALIVGVFALIPDIFWLVLLLNAAYSVVSQFFAPAEIAAIPAVVPNRHLITANGLFNLTMSGAQLVGFVMIGPLLAKGIPGEWEYVLLALVYAAAAVLVSLIRMEEPALKRSSLSLKTGWLGEVSDELQAGWRLLARDNGVALSVFHLTLMNSLILVIGMLAPGYVSRVIGIRADDSVFVMAPAGIGMLLGIALLPRIVQRWPKELITNAGIFGSAWVLYLFGVAGALGPALIAAGFLSEFGPLVLPDVSGVMLLVMVLALLLGFGYAMVNVTAQTLVQERVPFELRGRIFATQFAVANAAAVAPLLFLGSLADLTGINFVTLFTATVVLGAGIFSSLQTRRVRPLKLEHDEAL